MGMEGIVFRDALLPPWQLEARSRAASLPWVSVPCVLASISGRSKWLPVAGSCFCPAGQVRSHSEEVFLQAVYNEEAFFSPLPVLKWADLC